MLATSTEGHEVFSVYEEERGMKDDNIIQKASSENWILSTNDKGFGEKIYREGHLHKGVVLLRLDNEQASNKIQIIRQLLESYADQLADQFVTVTETQVRFASA